MRRRLLLGESDSGGSSGVTGGQYLTFKVTGNASMSFKFSNNDIEYSINDGKTFKTLSADTYTPEVLNGQTIKFRASGLTADGNGIGTFSTSGDSTFIVSGQLMTMAYGDEFLRQTNLPIPSDYYFAKLFSGCTTLTSANSLYICGIYGYTQLKRYCYYRMFYSCINLTQGPTLSPRQLTTGCYNGMFENCRSLYTMPDMYAEVLGDYCFANMFADCVSLVSINDYYLPFTALTTGCYESMFSGCTNIESIYSGLLPATTLADYCYAYMFYGCTHLRNAPTLPATTLASNCYLHMFDTCVSLYTPPALPATTLADYCYCSMFKDSRIMSAPSLPATTLKDHCYSDMFKNCSLLQTAPELPATNLNGAPSCYSGMFMNTRLSSAPELPATTLANWCYYYMFAECSYLQTAPILPATELKVGCYHSMFWNSSGLKTVPSLPASKTVADCYGQMFYSCKNLNNITCLATTTGSTAVNLWVSGVSPTGTFTKSASMSSWGRGINGIPSNWTVLNA